MGKYLSMSYDKELRSSLMNSFHCISPISDDICIVLYDVLAVMKDTATCTKQSKREV